MKESLKPQVCAAVEASGMKKLPGKRGAFIVTKTAKWSYSPVIVDLEKDLATKRKHERDTGAAVAEETSGFRYVPNKVEEPPSA
ncbi:MAG: hypothetical protein Q8Q08_12945 [Candidatus Omnitrophota bacterium]|nr:hypothetical protein [Candidatus Omnitrophota bacterium]